MPIPISKTRRNLSADSLHRTLRDGFEQIPDHRPQPDIPLRDALLSGFALFSLKDPSLLAFDARLGGQPATAVRHRPSAQRHPDA